MWNCLTNTAFTSAPTAIHIQIYWENTIMENKRIIQYTIGSGMEQGSVPLPVPNMDIA